MAIRQLVSHSLASHCRGIINCMLLTHGFIYMLLTKMTAPQMHDDGYSLNHLHLEIAVENHINWDAVRIHWDDYRDKIKDQWSRLSDDDLRDIHGDRSRLMDALQDRYALPKDKVEREVNDFFQASGSWLDQIKQKAAEMMHQSKQYVCDTSVPDMASDLQRVVRRYPLRSAVISLGIGYMLGKLSNMTSRFS